MKYLTYRQRIQIEALYRHKTPVSEIASEIGVSLSCIYKELKKGSVELMDSELQKYTSYSAEVAQQRHTLSQTSKGRNVKIGFRHDLAQLLTDLIHKEHYSPAAAVAEARRRGFEDVPCYSTIYSYIRHGVLLLSEKDLPRKGKKHTFRSKDPFKPHKVIIAPGIEDRPEHINQRSELCHWEMDCVCGKQGTLPALLVLTERVTRFEIIRKIVDKTMVSVVSELRRIREKYRINTITVDNGSEFRDYFGMRECCSEVYYCHPYRSGERGSNENANGIIRRFVPKGVPISDFSDEYIAYVQDWMNHYPRRILGYASASDYEALLLSPSPQR